MPTLIQAISQTVNDLALPGMKPKALIAAVREKHLEATKSDIVRAAFYAVITNADSDPEKASRMQAMALSERGSDSDEEKKPKAPEKHRKPKHQHAENGKAA